jgi:hypothetical protein
MICTPPCCGASFQCMPHFNVKSTREACVHVCITFHDVGVRRVGCSGSCSQKRHSSCRYCGDCGEAAACLTCDLVCKWRACVSPTALALSSASFSSSASCTLRCLIASSLEVANGWDVDGWDGELGGELHCRRWGSGYICKHCNLL